MPTRASISRRLRRPRTRALVACVAVLWSLAGHAHAEVPAVYVAMGDSFASGAALAPYDVDSHFQTGTGPARGPEDQCMRSPQAYPRLAAMHLSIPVIRHVACSGAIVTDITTDQKYIEPPQMTWLNPAVNLVTVTIGLNDMDWPTLFTNCFKPPTGYTTCRAYFTRTGSDYFSPKIGSAGSSIRSMLTQAKSKAPSARIIALEYPQIFPATTSTCEGYSAASIAYIREKVSELNRAIDTAAAGAGAEVIHSENAFAGHEMCTAVPYARYFHPNARGHGALAAALEALL